MSLVLEATEDILSEAASRKDGRIVVGFAAETENLAASARAKLKAKNLDMIVANDVSAGNVFDSDHNTVLILGRDGTERQLPRMTKPQVADAILDEVIRLRQATAKKTAASAPRSK